MLSPVPKMPTGDDLLRLYVELANDPPALAGDSDDPPDAAENVRHVRRALEMLDNLRRSLDGGPLQPDELTTEPSDEPPCIGPYQMQRELGRGGWGIVYLATDSRNGREVALKLPLLQYAGHPQFGRRFVREAKLLETLDHPNLIKVYEAGEAGWIWYLALEFCAGPNLQQWSRSQAPRIAPRQAAAIIAAVADGLEHVHQRGILHRDIKPTNILLDQGQATATAGGEGLSFVPRLVDFGLAKLTASSGETTHEGTLIGTPAYMSPEQALGRLNEICPASDTFALGVVLFELVAGFNPFAGHDDLETRYRVAKEPPPDLGALAPNAPSALVSLCRQALARNPGERYVTARAMADDLRRFLRGEAVLAPGRRGRFPRFSRRTLLAGAALAAAGPTAWLLTRRFRSAVEGANEPAAFEPVPVEPIQDPRLLSQWVFHRLPGSVGEGPRWLPPTAGRLDMTIAGQYHYVPAGKLEALVFDGNSTSVFLGNAHQNLPLPHDAMTAEAWVRWDGITSFGGIVGLFRDTLNEEQGWVLGYQFQKFSFMLKGTATTPLMTYLTAYEPFEFRRWYHVAGTYDGERQRLYVNGEMIGEATQQKGPILYPKQGFYTIGAYHDDDEFVPFHGQIHAVSVYNAALSPEEIRAHFAAKAELLPDMDRPHLGRARPMNSAQLWLNPPKSTGP